MVWLEGFAREFNRDEGWGVIDSDACPGGCFVHFSEIQTEGYRELFVGELVRFRLGDWVEDGYHFVAEQVYPVSRGVTPPA